MVGVYVRRFLLGCVWSLAVGIGAFAIDGEGDLPPSTLAQILSTAAVFPVWFLVGAIHHVRYVGYRGQDPDPRDLSRRPRRELSLPGLDLVRALAMVRELDEDRVLRVDEQADGGFVVKAARGGTWSRAKAHVLVAAEGEADDEDRGGGMIGVERVGMRIEGSISFLHGTDDGRALFLVLQLRDHFVDELRAHLISSPASPREPETAVR